MRKKSHISLARYMVSQIDDEQLKKHKFSFYLGSILPDIKPSFVYRKHEMTGTYQDVKRYIEKLSADHENRIAKKQGRKYYRDLGQVSHYLADYFTFPHNKIYPGSLKDHCAYEEVLKKDLRSYIKSDKTKELDLSEGEFENAQELCDFIEDKHEGYLEEKHNIATDIAHIIEVNHKAMAGILNLLEVRKNGFLLHHSG